MTATAPPRIAFVGWNSFQFLHFTSVAAAFPGATLVVEERQYAGKDVRPDTFSSTSAHILRCDHKQMRRLDGQFDVIVCQTPFTGIEEIQHTKIAMLQYGYAKEAHNFGAWRSFADLCLTFGDYAARKISPFSPCFNTGNPRYKDWGNSSFHVDARNKYHHLIDPDKKTVLYAPTSFPLSSYEEFSSAIQALSDEFNVILKLHHITLLGGSTINNSVNLKFNKVCSTQDDLIDLLAISDVVISDFSGAIFDAVYCRIPVILLDSAKSENMISSKSDIHSIERTRRSEIGEVVDCQSKLAGVIRRILQDASAYSPPANLRDDLFIDAKDAVSRAKYALHKLASGGFSQNQSQQYVRHEMRALYRCRADIANAFTVAGFTKITAARIQKWFQR